MNPAAIVPVDETFTPPPPPPSPLFQTRFVSFAKKRHVAKRSRAINFCVVAAEVVAAVTHQAGGMGGLII